MRLLAVLLILMLIVGCSSETEVEENEPSKTISLKVDDASTTESKPSVETSSDVTPTVPNTDQVGLFEYLDGIGNGIDDYDEDALVALTGTAFACADYVARQSETTELLVLGAVLRLSETRIGPAAASYFEDVENPGIFCSKAFPESSKTLVLAMLAGYSQIMCLLGGQGAPNLAPASAMDFAEIFVGYWGDDAPVAMSDFDGPEDYCAWIFDEENEHILELMEAADVSVLGAGG